VEEVILFLV